MERAESPPGRSTGPSRPDAPAAPSSVPPPPISLPAGGVSIRRDPNGTNVVSSPHHVSSSGASSVASAAPSASSSSPSSSSSHSSVSSASPSLSSQSSPQSTSSSPTSLNSTYTPLASAASLSSGSSPFLEASLCAPHTVSGAPSSPGLDSNACSMDGPLSQCLSYSDERQTPQTPADSKTNLLPKDDSSAALAVSSASSARRSTQGDGNGCATGTGESPSSGALGVRTKAERGQHERACRDKTPPNAVTHSSACSTSGDIASNRSSTIAGPSARPAKSTPKLSNSRMSENGLLPSKATGSLDSSSSSSPDGSPDFGLDLTVASERLDGGRTRLCDSLAAELAQQLELIVEDTPGLLATVNQDAKHTEESLPLELEIEGRLGVLIDLDTGTRLRLPLSSLTLLSSSFCTGAAGPGGGPPASAGLRFEAGVNQDQFASLQEFIMTMAVGKPPAGQSPSAGVHTLGGPGVAGQHLGEQKRGYDQGPSPPSGGSAPFASGAWQTAVQEEEEFFSDWASLIDESSSEDEGKSRSSKATRSKSRTGKGSPSHSPPSEQSPEVASWKPLAVESTEEEYHNLSCLTDTAIRLSYPHPKPTTGNLLPIAAVWKANQMTWNLYAGQDSQQEWTDDAARGGGGADDGMALGDDDNCRCRVDCRLAINLEHHASLRDVARDLERKTKAGGRYLMGQAQQGPNMRRIKKRQSFVHPCGVRIDLTEVRMDVGGGGKGPGGKGRQRILYEVETELNAALVLQAIQYKQLTGDSLPLLSLCVSFLTVLEDLSVHLNTVLMASPSASGSFSQSVASGIGGPSFSSDGTEGREPRFADLSRCFPPSASVALFKKYLSPCLPLVGDYAFRAVAPALARKGEEELKDYLSRINVDEESLYTNDTVTIVGPWVPCLNEEGRLEFAVPVARPSASVGDQSETMAKLLMS